MSTPLEQLQRAALAMRSEAAQVRATQAKDPETTRAVRWDPDTVDAVAGLLEQEARQYVLCGEAAQEFLAGDDGGDMDPAIVVARAYLREGL